jgi:transposase-like protein/IS1 family transposase
VAFSSCFYRSNKIWKIKRFSLANHISCCYTKYSERKGKSMNCATCENKMKKFGKNRNGSQRYRCNACNVTVTDVATRPVDKRRVPAEKMNLALRMLLEGNSIRAVERLTGIFRDTIINNMVVIGGKCKRFLERTINNLVVENVQVDEIWGFVNCKEKTRLLRVYPDHGYGDAYCYTAIERRTKLLIAWHLGRRDVQDTYDFAAKLRRATSGNFQLTTDGFHPYRAAVPFTFGRSLDFAVLVKKYNAVPEEQRIYSPPEVVSVTVQVQTGRPRRSQICTSHVERSNRTLRMQIRRLTRLTDAHSKKWENHEAALAFFFAYYNFCRVHSTIGCTPAVKSGLAKETWSLKRLLHEIVN